MVKNTRYDVITITENDSDNEEDMVARREEMELKLIAEAIKLDIMTYLTLLLIVLFACLLVTLKIYTFDINNPKYAGLFHPSTTSIGKNPSMKSSTKSTTAASALMVSKNMSNES